MTLQFIKNASEHKVLTSRLLKRYRGYVINAKHVMYAKIILEEKVRKLM